MAEPLDWILAGAVVVTTALALGGLGGRSGTRTRSALTRGTAENGPPRPKRGTPAAQMVQVMGFLMLGVVVSLVWLRLGSVDVALSEAGLGGGILGAVLVCCAIGARNTDSEPKGTRGSGTRAAGQQGNGTVAWWTTALAWLCGALLIVVLSAVWFRVDQQLPHWTDPAQNRLAETGVEHGITAVLLAFRAYDTLLESAVLMMAGLAALALAPPASENGPSSGSARTVSSSTAAAGSAQTNATLSWTTLSWAVRALAPVLLLVALWLLFAGSSDSGGAFQSGAVLAAMLILLHIGGASAPWVRRWLPVFIVIGVAAFLVAACLGPLGGAAWLGFQPSWSFAVILTVEALLTMGIAAALYAIFVALGLPAPRRPIGEVSE